MLCSHRRAASGADENGGSVGQKSGGCNKQSRKTKVYSIDTNFHVLVALQFVGLIAVDFSVCLCILCEVSVFRLANKKAAIGYSYGDTPQPVQILPKETEELESESDEDFGKFLSLYSQRFIVKNLLVLSVVSNVFLLV